ncbi:MAG: hypothetical protein ACRDSL_00895 [Pseudonocardiaceae bacterium]
MATSTGFVQQLSVFSGPTTCVWVGDTPSSAELLTLAVGSGDTAETIATKQSLTATLVEAAAGGRRVSVEHPDDSAAVSSVSFPLDNVISRPLQLDGLEVTQAVQDVSQSVPLLAGKKTVVRVYLSYFANPGITVTGQISLRKAPTDPPVVVASTAAVVLNSADAGDLAVTRNDASRSLNFVIPATMASEGPLTIVLSSVTDTVTGAPVPVGGERRPTVWFHRNAPLRVRIFGVRYTQGSPAVTYVPSDRDFELLLSWLARAYPAGQVHSTRVLITASTAPPFTCGDVNAQIAALRALDLDAGEDQRTHYYALVSDGGFFMRGCAGVPVSAPDPGAVGSGPTGSGTWGWDFDGSYGDWYGGHELGHTFGRRHPGFCGESNDDDDYPYLAGQLGGDDVSFMGFDVGDSALGIPMAALPGTQWKDVMTYCDFQWLSAYTYQGIKRRLLEEDNLGSAPSGVGPVPLALAAGAAPGVPAGVAAPAGAVSAASAGGRPDNRFPRTAQPEAVAQPAADTGTVADAGLVSVVATVNLTRRWGQIRYVNAVPNAQPSPIAEEGALHLRVTRADGTTMADYAVPVKLNSERDPGDDERGLVDAVIPVDADAAAIELVVAGEIADTFRAAAAPLEVQALRVVPGAAADDVGFRVEAPAAPAGGQSYYVQVSPDGGQTWTTVAVGLTDPDFSLDRSQFPAGREVLVRVAATNGFTRSVVATDSFRA